MFPNIFFNENTALYIYSALFQANAAILSIIGVFVIFRLQSIQSHIDTIKNYILTSFDDKHKMEEFFLFEQGDLKMKYQMTENQHTDLNAKQEKNPNGDSLIKELANPFQMWFFKERELLRTKNMIRLPVRLLLLALIINSLSLLFSSNLHLYHKMFEIDLGYINVIFEILVLLIISSRMIFMVSKKAPLLSAKRELNELDDYFKERDITRVKEWKDRMEKSGNETKTENNEKSK